MPELIGEEAIKVVQTVLDTIESALAQGHRVELRNFGVFEVFNTKERPGRNPNNPEKTVVIPARTVVKFHPGKEMKAKVLLLKDQE